VTVTPFGFTADNKGIDLITLRNQNGMEVRVMTYGGIILSIKTPDKAGQMGDVVLGHDAAADYFVNPPYIGALIGRYGNRIANAAFTLDGKKYPLAANNGVNNLHGGKKGWDQAIWAAEPNNDKTSLRVVLSLTSPDGDEGFPGTVNAKVTYTLTKDNELVVDYWAKSDKPTVINLTQHSYFNLSAGKSADILGHELTLFADSYTPVDATLIPTGVIAKVDGTPFDFRKATAIGARINDKNEQIERGLGYDHNWVLQNLQEGLNPAASVYEPLSGRTLEISTTEPGIQFYSGNFLPKVDSKDPPLIGKGGVKINYRGGFCLETQHYPDSPNHPAFPTTELRPGQEYVSKTVFKFGVR
jgi:aldose 1-epimerase